MEGVFAVCENPYHYIHHICAAHFSGDIPDSNAGGLNKD
jgi:hypothetical protein